MSGGPYALMWSGGKDGALALRRARASGLIVTRLLNFHDSATGRVRFHATRAEMLQAQAGALGLELHTIPTSWDEMDRRLAEELEDLRAVGYRGVVLGDIHLQDVRRWYEDRVTAAGLEHIEPIWGESPSDLLHEYVAGGGRALVTCVDLRRLDVAWLGRIIDERFASDIAALPVDACGEDGEYHSFAFAGPEFRYPLVVSPGERRQELDFAQLDVVVGDAVSR